MTKENKFWKGMLLGALAGGALSLLHKQTRQEMKENVVNVSNRVGYIVKNPGEVTRKIKDSAVRLKETVEQVSEDISYITEKVDELRELTPQVGDILKETKDAFMEEDLEDENL